MARKFITYFDKEGNDYTDELILAVKDKLDISENIKYILIASTSGESALKLADAIDNDEITIINVSHNVGFSGDNESDISEDMVKKLEAEGIKTYQGLHAFSGAARGVTNKYGGYSPLDVVADTFRMFSHGVKVAAEISLMAADAGLIPVGEEIIAIGGRAHGVDTAVILTPVNSKNLFNMKFHEIIAMPRD
ncbi:MAG: pyruvate kinase alpha/beta domain-containing protein [Methanobrevibacter sp.]|uniref:pyruvate kinase alpha/beta domain-containing protein n=1 Tax=Methanobrevibacter sp. TaxID=66852 RepID=UPI002E775848|nr:pyruvate kinase alpha/beta domain-containing protein [Methanobrevibacter sp.]MEE0935746.1 pyruvate kinase alpha/beta domain-containing protein [Methanobrevibacter sp.]